VFGRPRVFEAGFVRGLHDLHVADERVVLEARVGRDAAAGDVPLDEDAEFHLMSLLVAVGQTRRGPSGTSTERAFAGANR
jgi:hypothetical protein